MEKVIDNNNLCTLNHKSQTCSNNTYPGNYLAIHITLYDPSNDIDYTWKVHNDLSDSKHFTIIFEIPQPDDYKLVGNNANWKEFYTECNQI